MAEMGNLRLVTQTDGSIVLADLGQGKDHIFMPGETGLVFVGDFDGLYRNEDDPWDQSGETGEMARYYEFSRNRLMRALGKYVPGDSMVMEIGCGHGYLSEQIKEHCNVLGVDVSEEAVGKARSLHPGIPFVQSDVTRMSFSPSGKFSAVIIAQCWWYLLDRIDMALSNCIRCLKPGGVLILTQAFVKDQLFGAEIADGFPGALDLLSRRKDLALVEALYDDTDTLKHNDGLIVLRKVTHAQRGDRQEHSAEGKLG